MKISYAIPVHNEHNELKRLIDHLTKYKRPEDEIVIQYDKHNTTPEVFELLEELNEFSTVNNINIIGFPLNYDFASFKNNLKSHCDGKWIFQIDADEIPSKYLIENLFDILKNNPMIEVFWIPRINTVEGLTENHIKQWGWRVENGRVNFPDFQCRIFQNSPKIKWVNKVHEILYGHQSETKLPLDEEFCLQHHKTITRQEHQNKLYSTI
jgi:glycosyltransferase involved in cell wall biosynthesis